MKNFKILFLTVISILFIGCNDDDSPVNIRKVSHSIEVQLNENFGAEKVPNVQITLKNKLTSEVIKEETDVNGNVTIEVIPGDYTLNATITYTAEEVENKFGVVSYQNYSFNASKDIKITNSDELTNIVLETGRVGNIIIKQVYNAGSDLNEGAMYRDQFVELYNNSNEAIYLDGLCFAQIKDDSKKKRQTNSDYNYSDSEDGSYDWSKSIGNEDLGEKANEEYIYSGEVIQFPGNGEDYELLPGQSVIVAGTALNHKAPLVIPGGNRDGSDKVYQPSNPDLTVDLSSAPFEVYFGDILGDRSMDTDIDTPAENMKVLYKVSGGRDFILDPLGRDAFVIFRANEQDINNWRKVISPKINPSRINDNTKRFLQIPNSVIIDGVDLQNFNENTPKPHWLPATIDAGFIQGQKGMYSSESAIRKVSKTFGERVIYQDTNNSSNDFIFLDRPDVSSLN